MIKIDRSRVPIPSRVDLNDLTSKAKEEYDNALAALTAGTPFKSKDFKAYSNAKVREALIELFHGKCAYCENTHAASGDVDIEHFRPKTKVAENDDHPGYWWVAGDWYNLVMSCTHCNQNRTLEIVKFVPDEENDDDPTLTVIKKTVGKLDAFPTLDDVWVTDHDTPLSQEKPVLIDPTISDPEECFDYIFHDNEFCTIYGKDTEGRGAGTIEILGLNRRKLTEARFMRQMTLTSFGSQIGRCLDALLNNPSEEVEAIMLDMLDKTLDELYMEGDEKRQFAGMCRAFYNRQLDLVDDALGL